MYQRENYDTISLEIAGADAHQTIMMLFESLLEGVTRLQFHIIQENYMKCEQSATFCLSILNELIRGLNDSELAKQLNRVYDHCALTIHNAIIDMSAKKIDHVIDILEHLKLFWEDGESTNVYPSAKSA